MNSKKTILAVSIIAGLTIVGIGIYRIAKEQFKLLQSYCWKIKDVIINNVSLDNVNLTTKLLLKNQSDLDVKIISYDLKVSVNNDEVAIVKSNIPQLWKANSVNEIVFDVDFNPRKVFADVNKIPKLVADLITSKESIMINTKGVVTVKHSFIKITNMPVDYSISLADLGKEDETLYKCKI